MNNSQFPTARTNGLVVQDVPNEVLVYDLESNKAHCLNQTAAMVWKACDGKTSVPDISRMIGSQTGEKVSDDLVWLAIDQLQENNLLETQVQTKFAGQSRREALKKIGMASMIALPIIASLAAPNTVLASTSCSCPSGPGPAGTSPGTTIGPGDTECTNQIALGSNCGAWCQPGGICGASDPTPPVIP